LDSSKFKKYIAQWTVYNYLFLLLQEKISGLYFLPGYPTEGYSINHDSVKLKVNITEGTHALYIFDIPALGKHIQTKTGEVEIVTKGLAVG